MILSARSFAAVALCGFALVRAAAAQTAAVPPAATASSTEPIPEVQYDSYIEPFDDDPVERLRNIMPLPPPTPLFEDYDPLAGLNQNVKTSRVALTTRATFALGVTSVKVGDAFRLPFLMHAGPTLTAQTLKIQFDPKIVQALDAGPAEWTGATITYNNAPDRTRPERKFIAIEINTNQYWKKEGALMDIGFRAVGVGETTIEAYYFDMADDQFNTPLSLVRDGLVRVVQ
jgi:hypothetical protein